MALPFNLGQHMQALPGQIGGLLDPENPQNLTGMMSNPMFRAGMGILAANQDPTQNVFQGALQGLSAAKAQMQSDEDRERMQELRDKIAELIQQQQQGQRLPGGPLESIYEPMSQQQPAGGMLNPFMGSNIGDIMKQQLVLSDLMGSREQRYG